MSITVRSITISRAIEAQSQEMTKIAGEIIPEDVDAVVEELGEVSTTTKSAYFPPGNLFRYLSMVVPEAKMRTILGDPTCNFALQAHPGVYDPVAIGSGVKAVPRSQIESERIKISKDYERGLEVTEGLKILIVFAAEEGTLEPLKKQYIKFANSIPHEMIKFLCDSMAIQVTALDKDKLSVMVSSRNGRPPSTLSATSSM